MIKSKLDKMKKIEHLESIILELESWVIGKHIKDSTLLKIGKVEDEKQRDTIVNLLKDNITLMKAVRPDNHKLYLSEIVNIEKPVFESNNLILAPVGSGKTTLIKDILLKGQTGKILILTSNTALKNSICSDDNELREKEGHRMYTSSNLRKFGDTPYEIHVMSYSEFGSRIKVNNDFVSDVSQIYCDEIHSLPNYQQFANSAELAIAIKFLFDKHENKQLFYFTATDEHLKSFRKKHTDIFRNVKIFNYLNHPDIKKYMVLSEYKINRLEQVRIHLKARINSFNYFGYKCLAFNRTISGQKKIERIAIEEGFIPITLWSVNNVDLQMDEEQLRVRKHLLNYGEIPPPYNFLIINSAMQEGWNLTDDMVKLAIMNTTSETEKIQALGRYRSDIDILIYRVRKEDPSDVVITIPDKYLGIALTAKMKSDLCEEINIINSAGKVSKWGAINPLLAKYGYLIEDKYRVIDGKSCRVSFLSRP